MCTHTHSWELPGTKTSLVLLASEQIYYCSFSMPCLMLCLAFQLWWITEVKSLLNQFPDQISYHKLVNTDHCCTIHGWLTFWRYMFLQNLLSTRSITHYILTWKEMFGKQYTRSDSSLGIFGFSSKCSPSVSFCLQPAFRVPHGRDCSGPVGEWKVSTMDKGMCGTSHPFLLFLAAIIVWKCCRQLLHCTVHSQTIGNLPAFCTWKWCRQKKSKDITITARNERYH